MLRICRVTLALALFAAVPASAQTTSDQQTPPYSKDITKTTTTTTTTQSKDPTIVVQPAPPPPAPTITVQPAPPPPAQTITVQPAPPPPQNVTIVPPAQPVVEQHPGSVNVVAPERPEPMMAVSLGGGISEFREDAIRERTGVNGEYEARLLFGVNSPLAFEAAYVGTAVGLQGLSGENSATLLSNGVEGLARLNLGRFNIQPFLVGGAGWSHYSVVDKAASLSDVRDKSHVLV